MSPWRLRVGHALLLLGPPERALPGPHIELISSSSLARDQGPVATVHAAIDHAPERHDHLA